MASKAKTPRNESYVYVPQSGPIKGTQADDGPSEEGGWHDMVFLYAEEKCASLGLKIHFEPIEEAPHEASDELAKRRAKIEEAHFVLIYLGNQISLSLGILIGMVATMGKPILLVYSEQDVSETGYLVFGLPNATYAFLKPDKTLKDENDGDECAGVKRAVEGGIDRLTEKLPKASSSET